jgi:DNA-binding transcriptional LysR family regulator
MITIDRLRYFLAAAKLAHVGQAAKKMHVSPSVVSSAIRTLEDSIGDNLFIRENNRIRLNAKGQELANLVQKILDEVDSLQLGTWKNVQDLSGHFRLGGSHFLMQEFLIPSVLDIKNSCVGATWEFVSLDSGVAISQVQSGALDAALVFRSSYYEKLDEVICHEDHFKIYVKENHPILRSRKSKSSLVDHLNTLPAITFRTSLGANFWERHPAFQKLGIEPNHKFFYDDTASCIQLLKKTGGWAFLPSIIGRRNRNISELVISEKVYAPVNISLIVASKTASVMLAQKLEDSLKGCWSLSAQ